MLHGVYLSAFKSFLELLQVEWPKRVDDPLVGLFLLICDLSLNPGSGFPFHITPNFESFIYDVNPGARFYVFCRLVAKQAHHLKGAVRDHSRSEYVAVAQELCEGAKEAHPLLIAQTFTKWFSPNGPLSALRHEYEAYVFGAENYVIRHLFAHFLAFQEDKFKRPEFFCWPGAWMAGERVSEEVVRLFDKHGALFVDKEDDDTVFARLQAGREDSVVLATFNDFYHHTVIHDLTNQWISKSGPFQYDLEWLIPAASAAETKEFLRGRFKAAFGLDPEDVQLVTSDNE